MEATLRTLRSEFSLAVQLFKCVVKIHTGSLKRTGTPQILLYFVIGMSLNGFRHNYNYFLSKTLKNYLLYFQLLSTIPRSIDILR